MSLEEIESWIKEYPYAQYLHLLKAIKLKSSGITDIKAYHKSATVVTDRVRMNELIDQIVEVGGVSQVGEIGGIGKKNSADIAKLNLKATKEQKGKVKTKASKKHKKSTKAPKDSNPNKSKSTLQKLSAAEKNVMKSPLLSEKNTKKKEPENKNMEHIEVEESVQDWDAYITSLTSESFVKKIDKASSVKIALETSDKSPKKRNFSKKDKKKKTPYKPTNELSEFSEWLLALGGKDEEIDTSQIEKSVSIEGIAISETLARLMEKQGHLGKAQELYEKLRLIYPEKSAYFAALIEKLKKL
ncbi:MAG: hypothetical protein V3V00_02955 [Saprospiraceae bacterium]